MNGWVFEGHTLDIPKCVKLLPDNWALCRTLLNPETGGLGLTDLLLNKRLMPQYSRHESFKI